MDIDDQAPSKRSLLERLLDQGMVMVHLDARRTGVDVPGDLRDEADLRLNLSYRFAHGDLAVGEDDVQATLNFSGGPYRCEVPLPAIFALVSHVTGEGFFFPGDAPPEALAALAAMVSSEEPGADEDDAAGVDADPGGEEVVVRPAGPPILRAIDGGAASEDTEDDEAADRTHRPPHLRVVK